MLVAGLCRAFARRGLRVRPFKPQNMSNNAAVTEDGGEIGRAQALQARACGVPASVHMNPVLLKPQSEIGAQVVVQGKVLTSAKARDYSRLKRDLMPRVVESFDIATSQFDVVIIDEASQCDVLGLVAFALAKEVVVVGDHEQVSPYAVGFGSDQMHELIDEILVDIPNKKLYRTSLWQYQDQNLYTI